VWNNQVQTLLDGKSETFGSSTEISGQNNLKAILVEFQSPNEIQQLGNGVQCYDPLFIRLHIIHDFYDAQDGTMGQNLDVLDLVNSVFLSMQDWMPDMMNINGTLTQIPVGNVVRVSEEQDYDHGNLYHFIQTYKTTWIDNGMLRPVGGSVTAPPISYTLIVTPAWISGNAYVLDDEVTYLGSAYRCILNTTIANELPTNITYWILITAI
jgi:hypothetical protein